MKKDFIIIVISLFILLFLISCTKEESKAGIANPASTYCIEQGGKLEIRENAEGQYGMCILPDGTECEEWKYFRKECQKNGNIGPCREENTQCCTGYGNNLSCIDAQVECIAGYGQEFLGCDLEKCMPKWECVPMN